MAEAGVGRRVSGTHLKLEVDEMPHISVNRALPAAAALAAALLCLAGCPAKQGNKKTNTVKPPDYNRIWGDIEADGEKGQMDLKEARRMLQDAQTDEETDRANMAVVAAMKQIYAAVEKADKFFETMKTLHPDKNIDLYEKQVSEWNMDYQHSKKQLPLKYADELR